MSIRDVMERPDGLALTGELFDSDKLRRILAKLQDERRDLEDQEKALRIALKNVDQCTRENFTKMQVLENLLTAFGLPIEAEEDTDILMAGLADMELHGLPEDDTPCASCAGTGWHGGNRWDASGNRARPCTDCNGTGLSPDEALKMLDQHQQHD